MLCLAGVPAVVPAGEPAAHGVECVTTGDLQERVAAMSFAMKMASAAAGTGSGDQLPEHEDTLCPTPDSEHPETPRSRVLCDESACIKDGLTHLGARIAVSLSSNLALPTNGIPEVVCYIQVVVITSLSDNSTIRP